METKKQTFLDNIQFKEGKKAAISDAMSGFRLEKAGSAKRPVLFSRGKVSQHFFTEDSKLYITPKERCLLDAGLQLDRKTKKWDALSSRVVQRYQRYQPVRVSQNDLLLRKLEEKIALLNEGVAQGAQQFVGQFSMARLWNMSIVGAILVGMFSMSMIYRYLGQGAAAGVAVRGGVEIKNELVLASQESSQGVLGVQDAKGVDLTDVAELSSEELSKQEFEEKVRALVKGYPIEKMVPYILEKDRKTASFLVAIAKKESAWGVHSPVLNGQDCYNYWGYRGQRKLMGTGGHTCFNSRKDAVDTVAKRIDQLVNTQQKDTAAELIVWKCGSSCAGHGAYDVQKWISDVDMYYKKLN